MIIGITGTDGSGKGTVVEYLVTEKDFTHFSVRALLIDEIEKQGLPVDRNHMRIVANQIRKEKGNSYLIQRSLDTIAEQNITSAVVESVRAIDEAEALIDGGGILLAVDADSEVRYKRVQERRSESDRVTYEKFLEQEALEMNDPDPHGMQKAKVMEMASYTVSNNGTIDEFHAEIDRVLAHIE